MGVIYPKCRKISQVCASYVLHSLSYFSRLFYVQLGDEQSGHFSLFLELFFTTSVVRSYKMTELPELGLLAYIEIKEVFSREMTVLLSARLGLNFCHIRVLYTVTKYQEK